MKTPAALSRAAAHFVFASFIAALALLPAGCNRHETDTAGATSTLPAAKVRVAEARLLDATRPIELPGTVRAVDSAQLAPKIMGAVESIPVALGQNVKRGQVLVKILAGEINAKVAQAETGLGQANRDLARERGLLAKNASTAETVRNLEDRQRIAQAMVAEARAMLSYTTITAPFDGVVVGKFASEGDLAAPGHPLLALENPARLRVEAGVPESLARVAIGAEVPVLIAGKEITGRLAEVAPASDAMSRTFTVKIDLPANPAGAAAVQSGQFARVAWPGETGAMLVVPEQAVSLFGQMERVFVVDTGNRAGLRLVKTGAKQNDGLVEILSGLSAGEKVVVTGAATLRDGQPLEIQP